MGISPFPGALNLRTMAVMHQKFLLVALSLIVLATSLGLAPAALAQGYGYSYVGSGATVPNYTPGYVSGVSIPGIVTPNYIGSAHNSVYGTYGSPATGYQVNVGTGQPLTYRPNAQTYGGRYYGNGGRGGFSTTGLLIGGGMLGVGALAVGASIIANRKNSASNGGGNTGPNSHYEKDMQKADERRHKQEEKIQRELNQAHEAELKRKGILPTSAQGPAPTAQQFNQGRAPSRAKNSEDLEGDVVPTSATQKLDF